MITFQKEAREGNTRLFVQVRSIWLPANPVLALGFGIGVAAPGFCTVTLWVAFMFVARWCEERVHELSDDVCADRRAAPLMALLLPALTGSAVGMGARHIASLNLLDTVWHISGLADPALCNNVFKLLDRLVRS